MKKYIQKRFAMSEQGAKDFLRGSFWTLLQNLSYVLPVVLLYLFLQDFGASLQSHGEKVELNVWFYVVLAILFIAIIGVVAYFQYIHTYVSVYSESAKRRIGLAEKLRKLPLSFFGEKNLSDLTATIMEDAVSLEHTFSHAVPQLFGSLLTFLLAVIGLSFLSWELTLAAFWVLPVCMVLLCVKRKQSALFTEEYWQKRQVSERIQEGIDQIQEIKSYNHQQDFLKELNEDLETYEKTQLKGELFSGVALNAMQMILKLGLPSLAVVGALLVLQNRVELLTYIFYLVLVGGIYNPLFAVLEQSMILFFLDVRINRMNEILNLSEQGGSETYDIQNYTLQFQNVDFSYKDGEKILHGVSFTAKQGEVTALIGNSGGGKTTATKLAARFWDVDGGRILLGGTDISTIDPEALLKNYSIVFQEVVLFNASVLDNIRIGRKNATDEEVLRAASLARCDEFVNKLPEKYHTVIGENGNTLSGGERQRLSIARALLKDAPIVLFDEATASLDVENETKIQMAISELVKNKTVLIIAHRMRTVANADHIVVLENGIVVEEGNPQELLQKTTGYYHKMYHLQNSDHPKTNKL